jgi:hypothetical protein
VTLAYIARYDLGFSREEIRTFAVIAAAVGVALVGIEYFGKKLRKPNWSKGSVPRFTPTVQTSSPLPTVRRALLVHRVRPPWAKYRETISRALADIQILRTDERVEGRAAQWFQCTGPPKNTLLICRQERFETRLLLSTQLRLSQARSHPALLLQVGSMLEAHSSLRRPDALDFRSGSIASL